MAKIASIIQVIKWERRSCRLLCPYPHTRRKPPYFDPAPHDDTEPETVSRIHINTVFSYSSLRSGLRIRRSQGY